MNTNRRWTLRRASCLFLFCYSTGSPRGGLSLTDLDRFWLIACLFPLSCTVIYTLRDFSIRSRLVSRLRTVAFFPHPILPATTNTSQVGPIRVKIERAGIWTIDRLIDDCRMGAYLAKNTHRVAYYVTTPRWNLRAPPTTGSERRPRVVFHTTCGMLHMVTREALLWLQGKFINNKCAQIV